MIVMSRKVFQIQDFESYIISYIEQLLPYLKEI